MAATYINLGCGAIFIDSPDWINLDFTPASPRVRRANLLTRLPLLSNEARLVYVSHFLEHIPKPEVGAFLRECYRVLQPGGVLRLVLPDLQEMAASYLHYREAGNHERADFLVLEMIDQCVRRESGGELGRLYRRLRDEPSPELADLIAFVRERTGEALVASMNDQAKNRGGGFLGPCAPRSIAGPAAQSPPAPVDTCLVGRIASGLPRAKRQSCRCRRASSLAVGLPSVTTSAGSGRLHGGAAPRGRQQRDRGFPLPSTRHQRRWSPTQGRRVDVRGGAQARLTASVVAPAPGGRND